AHRRPDHRCHQQRHEPAERLELLPADREGGCDPGGAPARPRPLAARGLSALGEGTQAALVTISSPAASPSDVAERSPPATPAPPGTGKPPAGPAPHRPAPTTRRNA